MIGAIRGIYVDIPTLLYNLHDQFVDQSSRD